MHVCRRAHVFVCHGRGGRAKNVPDVCVLVRVCVGVGVRLQEQLNRRVSTVFGGGRPACVIDFVVGSSEVELFRSVERFTPTPILEMPVHVGEMFAA